MFHVGSHIFTIFSSYQNCNIIYGGWYLDSNSGKMTLSLLFVVSSYKQKGDEGNVISQISKHYNMSTVMCWL